MKLKKLLTIMLCLIVAFCFAACGGDDNSTDTDSAGSAQSESASGSDSENSGTAAAEDDVKENAAAEDSNEAYGELAKEVKAQWDELYDYGDLSIGTTGDTLKNAFFRWRLNSVETKTSLEGESAGSGYKFVIANITVTNTEDYEYSLGNFEWLGIVGTGDGDEIETMDSFYSGMFPDETTIGAGETLTGDLVFKVKDSVSEILIDYEAIYEDGSPESTNWFDVKL